MSGQVVSALAIAAMPALVRIAEMLVAATALAMLAWMLGQTRWVQQRPAVAVGMWIVVLAKAVIPWGPHVTWHYAGPAATAMPVGIEAEINAVHAVPHLLWWHLAVPLALGLWLAMMLWRLIRRMRAGHATLQRAATLPVADAATRQVASAIAREIVRGRPTPDVRMAATATTPFCIGARRPIVVVPLSFIDRPAHLRAALAHEFAHVQRRDLGWRALQLLIVDVLWFFPIAHLASRRLDAAREAACDAIAVAVLNIAPSAYGAMLVDVAVARRSRGVMAMAGNGQLQSRIAGLALPRKTRIDAGGLALLGVWLTLAAFSFRAQAQTNERPCSYSAELAESLLASHPEADLNADGSLSRDEVCGFEQAREIAPLAIASDLDDRAVQLLASMCCNCQPGGGTPSSSLELGPQACVEGAQ